MSVSDLQVYAAETSAVAYKAVASSGGGADLPALVDGSPATCATLRADPALANRGEPGARRGRPRAGREAGLIAAGPDPAAKAALLLAAFQVMPRHPLPGRPPALLPTCPPARAPRPPPATATIDLGYTGTAGSVAVRAGPSTPNATFARAFMRTSLDQPLQSSPSCNTGGMYLQAGKWSALDCNATGR